MMVGSAAKSHDARVAQADYTRRIVGKGREHVYVLTNASFPGLVKIGMTRREVWRRVNELSGSTGVPTPFELVKAYRVEDAKFAERLIHTKLASKRLASNKEFFNMGAADAVAFIDQVLA